MVLSFRAAAGGSEAGCRSIYSSLPGLSNILLYDLCRVAEEFSVSMIFCNDVEFPSKISFSSLFLKKACKIPGPQQVLPTR